MYHFINDPKPNMYIIIYCLYIWYVCVYMYMIFGIAFKVYKLLCALTIFQLLLFFFTLTGVSSIAGRFFTNWAIREAPLFYKYLPIFISSPRDCHF